MYDSSGFFGGAAAGSSSSQQAVGVNEPSSSVKPFSTPINLALLTEMVERAKSDIEAAAGRKLVLMIGRTGDGKSTTLNYLMGSRLELVEEGVEEFLKVAEGETEYAAIGHGTQSKTLYPQVVPSREFPDLAYADLPGFGDTRNLEEKLCSSIGVPMAVQYASAIQGMIIVIDVNDLISDRGRAFTELLETLGRLFKNPAVLSEEIAKAGQLLFVFTKAEKRHTLVKIIHTLKKRFKDLEVDLSSRQSTLERTFADLVSAFNLGERLKAAASPETQSELMEEIEVLLESDSSWSGEIRGAYLRFKEESQVLAFGLTQFSILKMILDNEESLFIIRGDEQDDKLKVLNRISVLRGLPEIQKAHFVLDDRNAKSEWSEFDKLLREMARYGNDLVAFQERALDRLQILRGIKGSQVRQKEQLEVIARRLEGDAKPSAEEMAKMAEGVQELEAVLETELQRNIEEVKNEKKSLKQRLATLDTAEPKRYHHRNLEPVTLEGSGNAGWLSLGIGFPFLLPIAGSAIMLSLFIGQIFGVERTLKNYVIDKLRYLAWPFEFLSVQILKKSHFFEYKDIPYLDAKPVSEHIDTNTSCATEFCSTRTFTSEVKKPAEGFYKVKFQYLYIVKAWIEMFVETRLHPDVAPEIARLKAQLAEIREMLSDLKSRKLDKITQIDQVTLDFEKTINEKIAECASSIELFDGKIKNIQEAISRTKLALEQHLNHFQLMQTLVEVIHPQSEEIGRLMQLYDSRMPNFEEYHDTRTSLPTGPVVSTVSAGVHGPGAGGSGLTEKDRAQIAAQHR